MARSTFLFPLVSLLGLSACATKSDIETLNGRLDGHDDQFGAMGENPGYVFTDFNGDGSLSCNVDELVDKHMTTIIDTSVGHVQTVRGWERVMVDGLSVNDKNVCVDNTGKAITLDRLTATIGTGLGKVGIGGGVTARCLPGMNGTPCTIKPQPSPAAPATSPIVVNPTIPPIVTAPATPGSAPEEDETSPA